MGKVWIQLFSLQLWVNSRADWVLQPWWGNWSRRRKTLNSNLVNSAKKIDFVLYPARAVGLGKYGYHLEYSDYWPHFYCYTKNVSADMSFSLLRVFPADAEAYTQSRTETFIWSTGLVFQFCQTRPGISYSKYFFLFSSLTWNAWRKLKDILSETLWL